MLLSGPPQPKPTFDERLLVAHARVSECVDAYSCARNVGVCAFTYTNLPRRCAFVCMHVLACQYEHTHLRTSITPSCPCSGVRECQYEQTR